MVVNKQTQVGDERKAETKFWFDCDFWEVACDLAHTLFKLGEATVNCQKLHSGSDSEIEKQARHLVPRKNLKSDIFRSAIKE